MARSKYNVDNTPWGKFERTVDGILFDSKLEASRYVVLRDREAVGEIFDLETQPRYTVQPAFSKNGKRYAAIKYVADFSYTDKKNRQIVEDVKGVETATFRIKRKLFLYVYPNAILRVIKAENLYD